LGGERVLETRAHLWRLPFLKSKKAQFNCTFLHICFLKKTIAGDCSFQKSNKKSDRTVALLKRVIAQ